MDHLGNLIYLFPVLNCLLPCWLSHLIDAIDVDGFAGDQLVGVDRQSGSQHRLDMNRGLDQLHIAIQTTPMTEMKRKKPHAVLDV